MNLPQSSKNSTKSRSYENKYCMVYVVCGACCIAVPNQIWKYISPGIYYLLDQEEEEDHQHLTSIVLNCL